METDITREKQNYKTYFREPYDDWYTFWFTEPPKGGKSKKRKTFKKNKRINKMRKPFRGGWTYKGSPSLDSKSSIITDTSSKTNSKTKSDKTRSKSSSSKSKSKSKTNRNNKKHKTKKVIKRSRR